MLNFKEFGFEYYLFFALFILIFVPFYVWLPAFILVFLILLFRGDFKGQFKDPNPAYIFILAFVTYSTVISAINQNILGFWISLFMYLYAIYFKYYMENAYERLFNHIVNVSLIASGFLFIFAFLEYKEWVLEWDYTFISPMLGREHPERVEATFFNPNYYAHMLEFFIAMGLYKMFSTKSRWKMVIYVLVTAANLLATFWTGNRTSPVIAVVAVIVFFYVLSARRTTIAVSLILVLALIVTVATGHYPRLDNISWALEDRLYIWETAIKGIQDNWLFGQGPLTYMMVWQDYQGKSTYHAHNILLDTVLSYGIVGISILLYPMLAYIRKLFEMRSYPRLRRKYALVISLIFIVLVHGIIDLAIFWFQTSFVFLVIVLLVPRIVEDEKSALELNKETG